MQDAISTINRGGSLPIHFFSYLSYNLDISGAIYISVSRFFCHAFLIFVTCLSFLVLNGSFGSKDFFFFEQCVSSFNYTL